MSDIINNGVNPEEMEEFDNVVTLTDEEGNDVNFEFLELVEYQGGEYVVLLPMDDEEAGEVVILQIIAESEDEETYAGVDDEAVLQGVFNLFKEKFKDEFDFTDED